MEIKILPFEQLTAPKLYELLQLRAEVFIVEQNCVYQDIDGKDFKALHVLGYENNTLVAYTRIFNRGDYFEEASIGKVLTHSQYRKFGYGKVIMQASIDYLENQFKVDTIEISAQQYLGKFYTELGFNKVGEGYLEDNIPHIKMIKSK